MAATGPQNVIPDSNPVQDPATVVPEETLVMEKNMAEFSKTKEFTVLKEYIESRIEFFQKHLPDGTPIVKEKVTGDMVNHWHIANVVIGEFELILQAYESAEEAVKNAAQKRNQA